MLRATPALRGALENRRCAHFGTHALGHRREEKQIDQIRIELRAAAVGNCAKCHRDAPSHVIATGMRYGVERVCNRDHTGRERNRALPETTRISRSVPALVVRDDPSGQIRIERGKRSEHPRATVGMSTNFSALASVQSAMIVNHVEQRFVNLAYVVKQSHALDHVRDVVTRAHRVDQYERISRYATHVRARDGIIGVDCIQQRLEGSGAEPLESRALSTRVWDRGSLSRR